MKLGKNMLEEMGLKSSQKWSGYQAQHVIPSEMANNPVIKKLEWILIMVQMELS
jgi:uncharacterized protein YneF (UPF0154 family)